jgi:ABC-2 type transport system permease protein/fluoroquinolone transport system permease protein
MKRFVSMFQQDLLVAYRSGHVLITGLLLVIMLALIVFLPRELVVHNELVLDASAEGRLAAFLTQSGLGPDVVFSDENAFRSALARQPGKVGVIFTGSVDVPHFEIIITSAVPAQNLALLQASLERGVLEMRGTASSSLPVIYLRPQSGSLPLNLRLLPVVLVFEVVLLGFLIAAVMMFQEKQEATLRAYRVTPAGTLHYIAAKNALFITLSLAYGLPMLLLSTWMFGLQLNYGLVLLLLVLSSSLMTMFSLAIAVFYRNLSEWFFVGVAVLMVNSLPIIAYGLPSFAPAWLTWIPSYPTVFATRDVLFYGAGLAEIQPTVLYLLALNLLAFGAAFVAIRYKLLKEGRS